MAVGDDVSAGSETIKKGADYVAPHDADVVVARKRLHTYLFGLRMFVEGRQRSFRTGLARLRATGVANVNSTVDRANADTVLV